MCRDLQLDGLKFVLIFLVVLGHLHVQFPIGRLVSSFHMPLFVLLSGYFTKISDDWHLFSWVGKTFAIYSIFILLNMAMDMALGSDVPSFGEFLHHFYSPTLAMWYLMCLLYWRLVAHFLKRMGLQYSNLMLVVSFILAMLVGFVPIGHDFSFQRFFALFPFFLLGLIIRERNWMERIKQLNIKVAFLMLFIGLLLSLSTKTYMPRDPYASFSDLFIRAFQTFNACMLCFAVIRLSGFGWVKKFAPLGALTLFFYLYHIPIVRFLEFCYPDFHTNVFEGVMLTICIVIFIWLLTKLRLFRWLMLQK